MTGMEKGRPPEEELMGILKAKKEDMIRKA